MQRRPSGLDSLLSQAQQYPALSGPLAAAGRTGRLLGTAKAAHLVAMQWRYRHKLISPYYSQRLLLLATLPAACQGEHAHPSCATGPQASFQQFAQPLSRVLLMQRCR